MSYTFKDYVQETIVFVFCDRYQNFIFIHLFISLVIIRFELFFCQTLGYETIPSYVNMCIVQSRYLEIC